MDHFDFQEPAQDLPAQIAKPTTIVIPPLLISFMLYDLCLGLDCPFFKFQCIRESVLSYLNVSVIIIVMTILHCGL